MLITLLAVLICGLLYSQSPALLTRDTLSANRLSLSVSVSDDPDLDSIQIILFEKRASDTLLISEFAYSVSDGDVSGFSSFNHTAEHFHFGLGLFDAGIYHCLLYIKRDGEWETGDSLE